MSMEIVNRNHKSLNLIKYEHLFVYIVTFFVLALLFLGIYFENSVLSIISVAISIPFIIWNPSLGIVFLFISSIIYYETLLPGISLYRIFVLITLFSFFIRIFTTKDKSLKSKPLYWIMLIIIISLISILASISPNDSIVEFLSLFINILAFIIIINIYGLQNQRVWFELITLSSSFLVLFLGYTIYEKGLYIYLNRISISEETNPNMFAIGIAQIIPFLISSYFLLRDKNFLKNLILVSSILVGIFLLIFTGSRSSILGMIIGINVVSYLCNKNNTLKKWFHLIIFNSLIVLVIFEIQFYNPHLFQRFILESVLESNFTRRGVIWNYLFEKIIPDHIWLGVGIGGGSVVKALAFSGVPQMYQMPAHNIFIDILAQLGVIGVIFFFSFYVVTLWQGYKNSLKISLVIPFYSIFITSLIIGIGETIFFNKLFWLSIAMIWRYESYKGGSG